MTAKRVARRTVLVSFAALAALTVALPAAHAWERVYTEGDVAIEGYDPVAYFAERKPVEGVEAFQTTYDGATWRFVSAANRDAFAADPEKYAPQFGGYCAYAVSEGYTASIDPDAWSIVDGRLYLNYSKSIQRRWEKNRAYRIKEGDRNWPLLVAGNGRIAN